MLALLMLMLLGRQTYLLHASQHAVALFLDGGDDAEQRLLLLGGGSGGRTIWSARAAATLPAEAWAGFPPPEMRAGAAEVAALLNGTERQQLAELCGRCLFEQLKMVSASGNVHKVGQQCCQPQGRV